MAIPSSGNISIKGAAGSGRSIDAEVSSVSSGSLVTLSTNAVTHNSVTSAPYGMREFMGYAHTTHLFAAGAADSRSQTNSMRIASSGIAAKVDNQRGGWMEDDNYSAAKLNWRFEIQNRQSGSTYTSTCFLKVAAGLPEGGTGGWNTKTWYNTSGSGSTMISNSNGTTWYTVWSGTWSNNGSLFCPDSWKIDISESNSSGGSLGTYSSNLLTSDSLITNDPASGGPYYWNDNTWHTYSTGMGSSNDSWSSRTGKVTAYTAYDDVGAWSDTDWTINLYLKKSGYDDTHVNGGNAWKFETDSQSVFYGI